MLVDIVVGKYRNECCVFGPMCAVFIWGCGTLIEVVCWCGGNGWPLLPNCVFKASLFLCVWLECLINLVGMGGGLLCSCLSSCFLGMCVSLCVVSGRWVGGDVHCR